MSAVAPIPEHLSTVTPRLVVRGAAAAVDFYAAAFGAEPVGERHDDGQGGTIHVEVRIGDAIVFLTDEGDGPAVAPPSVDGVVTCVLATYWADVDAAWARAIAAGAEEVFPLADQFYGERGGRLRDPFGHQWMLSQRLEILTAAEVAERAAGEAG